MLELLDHPEKKNFCTSCVPLTIVIGSSQRFTVWVGRCLGDCEPGLHVPSGLGGLLSSDDTVEAWRATLYEDLLVNWTPNTGNGLSGADLLRYMYSRQHIHIYVCCRKTHTTTICTTTTTAFVYVHLSVTYYMHMTYICCCCCCCCCCCHGKYE